MEDKITLKLSRDGMIAIRSYCEYLIEALSRTRIDKTSTDNKTAIYNYAQSKAACFELRKVCEKMNKATYLRGFDTKEYRMSLSHSMAFNMANYHGMFCNLHAPTIGDYENMVIRSSIDIIWKELTK